MSIAIERANVAINETAPTVIAGKPRLLEIDSSGNLLVNVEAFGGANFTAYSTGQVTAATGVLTVPAGKKWIVKSVVLALTDSATAGTRRAQINIAIGATVFGFGIANVTQAANANNSYVFASGMTEVAAVTGSVALCSLAEHVLSAGMTISDASTGIQTGDVAILSVNVIELPA